jgi:hypothetical protein
MLSRLKLYVGEEHPHQAQVNAAKGVKLGKGANAPKPEAAAKPKAAARPKKPVAPEPETVPPDPEALADDLLGLTVARLKELAGERGVAVPSKARKADIIEALLSAQAE